MKKAIESQSPNEVEALTKAAELVLHRIFWILRVLSRHEAWL